MRDFAYISKLEFRNIVLEMGIVNQSFNYPFTTSTAKMPDSMFIKDCMRKVLAGRSITFGQAERLKTS
jgi:hypothetical protein